MGLGAGFPGEAAAVSQTQTAADVAGRHYLTKSGPERALLRHVRAGAAEGLEAAADGRPLLAGGLGRVLQLRRRHRNGLQDRRVP